MSWRQRAAQAPGYLFDSMDTVRCSGKDRLFWYAPRALHELYQWTRMQPRASVPIVLPYTAQALHELYQLAGRARAPRAADPAMPHGATVGVVTNGTKKEWMDFAAACLHGCHEAPAGYGHFVSRETVHTPHGNLAVHLTGPVGGDGDGILFGVTEGGSVYNDFVRDGETIRHRKVVMVPGAQLAAMQELKAKMGEHPFAGRLAQLYDTPYDTASVLTLPKTLHGFRAGVSDVIPTSLDRDLREDGWIGSVLLWLGNYYGDLAQQVGGHQFAPYLSKEQNRRGYQNCRTTFDGRPLNKKSGVEAAAAVAGRHLMGDHVYTSDRIESAPERVMLEGAALGVDVLLNGDLFEYDERKNILRVGRFDQFTDALVRG